MLLFHGFLGVACKAKALILILCIVLVFWEKSPRGGRGGGGGCFSTLHIPVVVLTILMNVNLVHCYHKTCILGPIGKLANFLKICDGLVIFFPNSLLNAIKICEH